MSKKGMELPINMIVVVLIAVLVLVTIGAFLAGQLGSGQGSIKLEQAFGEGCQKLRSSWNCADLNFEVSYQKQGSASLTTPFSEICQLKGLTTAISNDPGTCVKACGCNIAP